MNKTCTKCGETKPLEDFYKRKDSPDGYRTDCVVCFRVHSNTRYAENPEYREIIKARVRRPDVRARKNELRKIRYEEDPEYRVAQIKKSADRYGKKKKQINVARRLRRETDHEWREGQNAAERSRRSTDYEYRELKRKISRASHARHKEDRNAALRERWTSDPEWQDKIKAANREYGKKPETLAKQREYRNRPEVRSRRNENQRQLYQDDLEYRNAAIVRTANRRGSGSIPTDFPKKQWEEQSRKCYWCAKPTPPPGSKRKTHIDHIKPLAKEGETIIDNLVIACAECNLSKHDKDPIEWARARGRLF